MPKKTNTKKDKKGGYLSRSQAIRYLQVSLSDFRRLCILKGIYPRDLTGKAKQKIQKGSTKAITAYYRKDIQYLLHEPLLQKFREHKIFARKLTRALGRGDVSDAKRIDENRPRYTLDHIIKERYPTFLDALGDIDDALSMIFLFATMPATDKVTHRITHDCERLASEWMAFIAREGLLRKVFVSIKGVYYQANVKGQDIMWIVPFKFPQNVPSDIDFKIMLTFLEFYTTLIHFVLYRLYTEAGLVYPPPISERSLKGVGGISGYILESSAKTLPSVQASGSKKVQKIDAAALRKAEQVDADAGDAASDNEEDASEAEEQFDNFEAEGEGDVLVQPVAKGKDGLFSKFKFFVGREVPLEIVEFLILAFGGKLVSESVLDELVDNEDEKSSAKSAPQVNLDGVTHQICDRPSIPNRVPGRVYVQPQWLMDSINQGKLVSVGDYAPGETLPPHLSPWGDRGTYDPAEAAASNEGGDEAEAVEAAEDDDEEEEVEGEEVDEEAEEEDEDAAEEERLQKELQLEASGVKFSESKAQDAQKKSSKKRKSEDEEKELRKMMMSNKQRKLFEKMQYSNDKKQAREDSLKKKRRKLDAEKEKLSKQSKQRTK